MSLTVAAMCAAISLVAAAQDPPPKAPPAFSAVHSRYTRDGITRWIDGDDAWRHDPLLYLSDEMKDIGDGLSHFKTDQPVQTDQKDVVSRLDELIKELEKSSSSNGGSNPNPSRPMGRSQIVRGSGGKGQLNQAKGGEGNWGELPPKRREQILQSTTEGFPPGYEQLLQSYYQRLAQERVGDEPPNRATTKPAAR